MTLSTTGADLGRHDPDRLLQGYRAARAQDTLFDVRGGVPAAGAFGATGFDEFVTAVECRAFRHGRIFGSPFGEPSARYYAEFEWDDMDAFKAATSSEAFAASGRDAMEMGIPFTVHFASIE